MSERIVKTQEQALASLMRLCARAEKSSGDAMRLMSRWGVDASQREAVLQRLIKDRFIDDERYASAFVREKSRLNGWGAYKIKSALRSKGISTEIIEREVGAITKDQAFVKLETMLRRRLSGLREPDAYKLKGKLLRYGLGLGYEYESVMDMVERIVGEES